MNPGIDLLTPYKMYSLNSHERKIDSGFLIGWNIAVKIYDRYEGGSISNLVHTLREGDSENCIAVHKVSSL